jgi:hypothetical protein
MDLGGDLDFLETVEFSAEFEVGLDSLCFLKRHFRNCMERTGFGVPYHVSSNGSNSIVFESLGVSVFHLIFVIAIPHERIDFEFVVAVYCYRVHVLSPLHLLDKHSSFKPIMQMKFCETEAKIYMRVAPREFLETPLDLEIVSVFRIRE